MLIDTHCHLDHAAFAAQRESVRHAARSAGVALCVIPAVEAANWEAVRALAQRWGDGYALGIHPLCVAQATAEDLERLHAALLAQRNDPHLLAIGETGLDFAALASADDALREKQRYFFQTQLQFARQLQLPVLLHTRRATDAVLHALRQHRPPGGIAHAFSGSAQQAAQFLDLGCKLGLGGSMTFERAKRLRQLAATLPPQAIVLETDAPDMAAQWLYVSAAQRAAGQSAAINRPQELLRIAQTLAALRSTPLQALCAQTSANAHAALPGLAALRGL